VRGLVDAVQSLGCHPQLLILTDALSTGTVQKTNAIYHYTMAEGRVPHCDGCAEPRKPHSPGWSVRELKQIAVKAKEGCLTCSLVQEGIDYFVADSEQPERIVLNWYMSGGKSFFARVNATLINYYITESTCPSRQPIAIPFVTNVSHFIAKHNITIFDCLPWQHRVDIFKILRCYQALCHRGQLDTEFQEAPHQVRACPGSCSD
jgi:hypothetical protein